ncbi:MAG: thermonuclease family protein [Cyanobacteria bacterium]|nr:thermonuclease family protein [Cyanobacteriota bacterium]
MPALGYPHAPTLKPQLLLLLAIAASIPSASQLSAAAAPATEFRATVLSIGDGDTIRVSRQGLPITIRLACIDAPELAQSPYGQQSRSDLQTRLAKGREVTILPHTTDRYGRTVAEVIRGININLVLVEDGQAFAYRQYLGGCEAKKYLDAEYRASRHRYGVWQGEGGITRPWDFRRGRRSAVVPDGTTPDGRRYRCQEIGSYARAQELLRQGHTYLDSNGDGEACESLR